MWLVNSMIRLAMDSAPTLCQAVFAHILFSFMFNKKLYREWLPSTTAAILQNVLLNFIHNLKGTAS